ncbi:hypothetical protein ACFLW1_00550 [Chloroflexota bacterium]
MKIDRQGGFHPYLLPFHNVWYLVPLFYFNIDEDKEEPPRKYLGDS